MLNYTLEALERADKILENAEADYERETAHLVRLLGGTTIWARALARVKEEKA